MNEQEGEKGTVNAQTENLVQLDQSRSLPGSPSRATLYRARTKGIRSRKTGETVKLETTQICGRLYVSLEAYQKFLNLLNGIDLAPT